MKEWFKHNIVSTISLGTLLVFAYNIGFFEQRIFTAVEMRIKTEDHVNNAPTQGQLLIIHYLDSIERVEAKKARQMVDSILKSQDSTIKHLLRDQRQKNILLEDIFKKIKVQPYEQRESSRSSTNGS